MELLVEYVNNLQIVVIVIGSYAALSTAAWITFLALWLKK